MLDLIDAEARRLYRDVLATGKGPICAPETRRLELIAMNLLRQREANTAARVKPIDTPETMAAIMATYLAMAAHMAACGSFFDEVAQLVRSRAIEALLRRVDDRTLLAANRSKKAAICGSVSFDRPGPRTSAKRQTSSSSSACARATISGVRVAWRVRTSASSSIVLA